MKSSSGEHYLALDHVRALAAYLVFTWHFVHSWRGYPIAYEHAPEFFLLSLLDEGHTGVALFMTLSGYLFAKLLDGKSVDFRGFLWNRALRLVPLLSLAMAAAGLMYVFGDDQGRLDRAADFAGRLARGLYAPSLPNGGWSLTVEFHFYLVLPLLLALGRRHWLLPLAVVAVAVVLRAALYAANGEVQSLAFWTLVGRIDQFVLGMAAFSARRFVAGRHALAIGVLLAFAALYAWGFDARGGFHAGGQPSPEPLWIVLPTLEGFAYAIGIAWYDQSFQPRNTGASAFIGRIGQYSYSIYLLHFFFVFEMVRFVYVQIMPLRDFHAACAWAAVGFLLMVPLGHLSYRYIESPFLCLRRPYVRRIAPEGAPS